MSESKELKPPENTITHRLNIMDCVDRIRQTEVILLISCSGYDERLMWSMCFATDWRSLNLIDDRLYSAILRSLEQTHCARMRFYMSD